MPVDGAGIFAWVSPTDDVGTAGEQLHEMTFTPTDKANYNTLTRYVAIMVSGVHLSCASVPLTGFSGQAITPPALTCSNNAAPAKVEWTNAPVWGSPVANIYSNIGATADCGTAKDLSASCGGTLTVSGDGAVCALSDIGYEGSPVAEPVALCRDGSQPSQFAYAGNSPDWNNPVVGTYPLTGAGICNGQPFVVDCGTLEIKEVELACDDVPDSGTEGVAIAPPALSCNNGSAVGTPNWANAPTWANPAPATYSNVGVSATCGSSGTKTATCGGSLTVEPLALYCNLPASTGVEGTAIAQPVVTCRNGNAPANTIILGSQPNWSNPVPGYYEMFAIANCGEGFKTANCGTLTVDEVTLVCSGVPTSGSEGVAITTQPTITCSNSSSRGNITWSDAPTWSNPEPGTYNSIKATATCGGSAPKTVTCGSTLLVVPATIECAMAKTGSEGTAIAQPTVTCKDNSTPTGINFTNAPNWSSPLSGTYPVLVTANCSSGASPQASCGTLTVDEVTLTCGSLPASHHQGIALPEPTVTCSNGSTRGNITWSNAPAWSNPQPGTFNNIKATATCGSSAAKIANCSAVTVNAATLTCGNVPATGYTTIEIAQPTVTCSNGQTASNVRWDEAPNWVDPNVAGTYNSVKVRANCGLTNDLNANCNGSLTVQPILTCSLAATTGFEGTAMARPTVACNYGALDNSSIVYTGNNTVVPNWDNLGPGTYNVLAAAKCGGKQAQPVSCGTLNVAAVTLSCAATLPSSHYEGIQLSQPSVTCSHGTTGTITWANQPNWSNPVANTYTNVTATANCGLVTKTANCGSVTVNAATLSCTTLPSSHYQGKVLTEPTVNCNNGIARGAITWTNNPAWSNPQPGTYSNVTAQATCGLVTRSVNCGSTTVNAATLTCNGALESRQFVGTGITAPSLTCNNETSATNITWSSSAGQLNWSSPAKGKYGEIKATANCGLTTLTTGNCTDNGGPLQVYETVAINGKTWMKENLNYNNSNSVCYGDNSANCDTYGRLYNFSGANAACPSGWSLPNDYEVQSLFEFATTESRLKATSGWSDNNNGTNETGFSALPGGKGVIPLGGYSITYSLINSESYWWSAVYQGNYYYYYIDNNPTNVSRASMTTSFNSNYHYVRCVKN